VKVHGHDQDLRAGLARAREWTLALVGDDETGTEEVVLGILETWCASSSFCQEFGIDFSAIQEEYSRRASERMKPIPGPEEPLVIEGDFEQIPRARILDANLNRAREGFRVVEDVARFAFNDSALAQAIKECRHELRHTASFLPTSWRIDSRDVAADVGTEIRTFDEMQRESLLDVARANIARVQEALRTLEEVSKMDNSLAARQFAGLRYRAYEIEQLIYRRQFSRQILAEAHLYWLAEPDACVKTFEWTTKEVLAAGVRVIQYRDKNVDDLTRLKWAEDLRRWTASAQALLIINDRPDIARMVGADGVHVGQEDLPPERVRGIIGPERIVGVSTHHPSQVLAAVKAGADYLGVGPVFPSQTKSFDFFPGLEYVNAASKLSPLPQYCIGGITPRNIEEVLAAGGKRVAVGRCISACEEPSRIVNALKVAMANFQE
jgi:thiamine-phosphate pyrophosphorylase